MREHATKGESNDLCISVFNADLNETLANHDAQRRRRVAKLAHLRRATGGPGTRGFRVLGWACEAGRVGKQEKNRRAL